MNGFLSSVLLFFSFCSESPDETLSRLKTELSQGRADEVLEEAESLLAEMEEEYSSVIYDNRTDILPLRTFDGSTAFWMAGDDLYYYTDSLQSIDTDLEGVQLGLSYDGSHAAVMDAECTIAAVSLVSKEIITERRLQQCTGKPTVDENGTLYVETEEGIAEIPAGADEGPLKIAVKRKEFLEKYKKIANSFHLYDGPGSSLIIFYGNAGYYRLYAFKTGSELKYIGDSFVKPELFFIQESDLLDQTVSKEKNLLEGYDALLLHGSSGKYSLKAVSFSSRKLKKISIPYLMRKPAGFASSGKIYHAENRDLISYHPGKKIREKLPFAADFVLGMKGGFLYRDKNDEFRVRKKALTAFEKDLFSLISAAIQEKRKDEDGSFQ